MALKRACPRRSMPASSLPPPRSLRSFNALLAFVGVVPVALFGLLASDGRQKALDQAAEHTRKTVAMLHEHALKVFETHELILRQADSWGEGRNWDTIERDERVRRALRAAVDGSGQVKSIWMM